MSDELPRCDCPVCPCHAPMERPVSWRSRPICEECASGEHAEELDMIAVPTERPALTQAERIIAALEPLIEEGIV